MKFCTNILLGLFIGAGGILPGISSGVLCVIFDIYEKLLDSILNFFKDVRKNFKFLFPIVLGMFFGVILFSNILQYILYKFPIQTKAIFIGLILGGTILLVKEINNDYKFERKNLIFLITSLLIGIAMVIIENKVGVLNNIEKVNFLYLVFSGFLMSAGIIVPGVSSTIILMLLGTYSLYLNSLSTLYINVLIPMFVGVFLGSLVFMKVIKYLLENYYIQTMYIIIGFTIGSIFVLLPEIKTLFDLIISLLCIICGYLLTNVIKK